MRRRKFALSWGRKLFFGISWPLSSFLGFLYLKSFIFPESGLEWFYFATTFIGHFGLLNALAFFLLYTPVILLMPTYYVSRFWSLILILCFNAFIAIDALCFSSYHLHIYSYIFELLKEEGFHYLFSSNAVVTLMSAVTAVFALLIWLRGEMVWRQMQGRFSNPVKNWYLLLILICLGFSKGLYHFADVSPKLSELFPLNLHFPITERPDTIVGKFYYPSKELSCQGKQNPNIVLLVIKEWNNEQFNTELMPKTFHMKKHATNFNSHMGVSADIEDGLFSLFYSVPAVYRPASQGTSPAIFNELKNRKYEMVEIKENPSLDKFKEWLQNRTGEETAPYYLSLLFQQHSSEADIMIHEIVLALQKSGLLHNTHIMITGGYAGADSQNIPLLWVTTDRKVQEITHVTTQYDVMPTLMQRAWSCKNVFKAASVGEPLELSGREWIVSTTKNGFKIIDFKTNSTIMVEARKISTSAGARKELIFSALKQINAFDRP